ncbi:MAG: farnesyl diphosphate synthase [PS1 clade bacterium]|jgi:farnesyl diphosphate synthase/geranylgeranyl diphosphate synthase type II
MFYNRYIDRIENHLRASLPASGPLSDSMRYAVLDCGKRFRPVLIYTIAEIFEEDLTLFDSSACAIELIHAYSLIHDDLPSMDNDDIRHSKPSCHIKFGEDVAILTGDALQAMAFKLIVNDANIATNIRIKCIQQLTNASFEMALGQAIDVAIVSESVDIDVLKNMHSKKTGALLSCAVKMGSLISKKCNDDDAKILDNFSNYIGLAYQIQDDVLDIMVPEHVLGKRQNSDQKKNKPTYPAIIGLESSKIEFEGLYDDAIKSLDMVSFNSDKLKVLTKQLRDRKF